MSASYLIKSVTECETAFAESPHDAEHCQAVCRDLGNLLQGIGRFDEAMAWHSLSLDSEPDLPQVYTQLGRIYAQEAHWEKAVAAFNQVLKLKPDAVHIYSNLAQIYGQMGQKKAEVECWYKALESEPEMINAQGYYKLSKAFEQFGDMEKALVCLQRACDRSEEFLPAHYDMADILLRQRKLELAKEKFQYILKQDPQQAKAHYSIGNIYLQQGLVEAAAEEFRTTIKIAPEFAGAYRDLVKTFLQLEKWDEAISTCNAIINLVEEFPWAYILLGDAFRAKGKITDAVVSYKKACILRGWTQCSDRDYYFTRDYFSYRLPTWQPILQPLMGKENLKILELGSYDGMSTCWFLDSVLTDDSAQLVCIDPQIEPKLKDNLAATKAPHKVTLLKGTVKQHLPNLPAYSFDLANLQDRRKSIDDAFENSQAVWQLLKVGGLMIFNDYGWRTTQDSEINNPKAGIDSFLKTVNGQWESVSFIPQSFQLIIKKIA